ncbi:MAG: transporter [Phycisphaeraceae bacterium]|nr:transporter [Phycisphaeraceae bacterium]
MLHLQALVLITCAGGDAFGRSGPSDTLNHESLSLSPLVRVSNHERVSSSAEIDIEMPVAAFESMSRSVSLALMQDGGDTDGSPGGDPASGKRLRSWELPAMTVVGEGQPLLREEELVGSYRQPRWTTTRRFPTTRVYVVPEGKVEVEGWARGTFEGDESEWRFLQEVEIGLPGRFQLDLYLRQDYDTADDELLWGTQFEVRWALADWNKIWGNPTLYFEYIPLEERPDKIEPKLLLGGEIAERWHWGANFVAEWELGGEREHEYQITTALSYSVIDSTLSLGVENIFTFADVANDRGDFTTKFAIGPSIQWKPLAPLTFNISPLIGIGKDSPDMQLWINVGWEF